jgi:hypothetical protein
MYQDIKKYPYFYKICEACDNMNPKESPFCMYCSNYRFEDNINKVSKRADELLTLEDDPLQFET